MFLTLCHLEVLRLLFAQTARNGVESIDAESSKCISADSAVEIRSLIVIPVA